MSFHWTRAAGAQGDTIADRITSLDIPRQFPAVAEGGWGVGRPCVVCEQIIRTDQAEVEAHFRSRESHAFHARCFVHWWSVASAGSAMANAV